MSSTCQNENLEGGEAAIAREDYDAALKLFEASAAEGSAQALTYLATMYEDGLGIPPDPEKSLSLLFQAVDLGDAEAYGRLRYLNTVGKFNRALHAAMSRRSLRHF